MPKGEDLRPEPWLKMSIPLNRSSLTRAGTTKTGKPFIEIYSFHSFKIKFTVEDPKAIGRLRDLLDEAEKLYPAPKKAKARKK